MKKRQEPTATTFSHSADDGPTTEHNYRDRFVAYVRAHGNEWHVIRSDRAQAGLITPAAWLAWMEWFFRHDIPHNFAYRHGVVTVPSQWPEEFDSEAEASDRQAVFPQKPWITPARKADLLRRMRDLVGKLGNVADPRRPNNPLPPSETPEAKLARLSAHYRATPPQPLSEAARAGAGLSADV